MGRIVGVYGVKGWIKILSFTRPLESLLNYHDWWVGSPGFASKLVEGRAHAGGLVAEISDADGNAITDRDVAARLLGMEIAVPRSAMPKLKPGEIYLMDLVGMSTKSITGEPLGVVESVTNNGAQDVLVLRDEAVLDETGQPMQRLIPFVRGPIIESVSLEANEIIAHWHPGY